jgi:hypothetical protein
VILFFAALLLVAAVGTEEAGTVEQAAFFP